jgi:hypothetical protein
MRFVGISDSGLISEIYYKGAIASENAFKTNKSTCHSDRTSHITPRAWNKERTLWTQSMWEAFYYVKIKK